MTKKQFLTQHGDKKVKDVAGILHIYIPYTTIEKHYDLENHIMVNNNMKVKDVFSKFENLLEFEKED
jgi:hypothetical protein